MLVVISAMVLAGSIARDLLRRDWRNDNPARVAMQSSADRRFASAGVIASRRSGAVAETDRDVGRELVKEAKGLR
jgi:hypothetical protein